MTDRGDRMLAAIGIPLIIFMALMFWQGIDRPEAAPECQVYALGADGYPTLTCQVWKD